MSPRTRAVSFVLASLVAVSGVALARQTTVLDVLRSSSVRHLPMPRLSWRVTIENAPFSELGDPDVLAAIYPFPGEEGEWEAIRFPVSNDLDVDTVTFAAANAVTTGGIHCSAAFDRKVDLYVSADKTPPADEAPVASFLVPGADSLLGSVLMEIDLVDPVHVPAGSALFVAFDFPGTSPSDVACVTALMFQPADDPEAEFWSNAVTPPFTWLGFDDNYGTEKPFVSISGFMSK